MSAEPAAPQDRMTDEAIAPAAMVVIGASAGAVETLSILLTALPADYPLPVIVVVHIPADRPSLLPDLFRGKCRPKVCEAEDKEPLEPATIYFAPPDYHLLIEADRRLSLSSEEPVHYSRPSIDVLFETAADAIGSGAVGIILSGASADGARGLHAIHAAGGQALVLRPDLAPVPVMPLAALAACPQARSLSLEQLAVYLLEVACRP